MATCPTHGYQDIEELHALRSSLLNWYDQNKRDLPWRTLAQAKDDVNIRAYGVWVSEVMLQQTQVSTVIDYYIRWMEKWPTVEALAAATLEEVRAAWAGLGYYSRGERLWKGAQKVVLEMGGVIPGAPEELMKSLPGVGRYTAGAVASIAFGKVAGIVDGNVVRVLSRQRLVGGETSSCAVTKHLWKLAELCVDLERPGDFNQALMELGATVCTPRNPRCKDCPISASCLAYRKERVGSRSKAARLFPGGGEGLTISQPESGTSEEAAAGGCALCLSEWKEEFGVTNYPHKAKRKTPPVEEYSVAVMEDEQNRFLLKQRQASGLLAGMWEFPSVLTERGSTQAEQWKKLQGEVAKGCCHGDFIGTVTHQFSHVHHHYHCWHVLLGCGESGSQRQPLRMCPGVKWFSREDLARSPVPASVNKILKSLDSWKSKPKKRFHDQGAEHGGRRKKQRTLNCFIKKD